MKETKKNNQIYLKERAPPSPWKRDSFIKLNAGFQSILILIGSSVKLYSNPSIPSTPIYVPDPAE